MYTYYEANMAVTEGNMAVEALQRQHVCTHTVIQQGCTRVLSMTSQAL